MENLTKYALGVAAKSNVEKRQVGCIIVDTHGQIVAEGFNTEHATNNGLLPVIEHAEAAACEHMCAQALDIGEEFYYTAYITHQPCPACAKMLLEYGVKEVIVVEAFMKFDGDKARIDLVDPDFALLAIRCDYLNIDLAGNQNNKPTLLAIKQALYAWTAVANDKVQPGAVDLWKSLLGKVLLQYDNFYPMEEALATVLTFGARKYKPNNWKECTDTGRYLAAAHRHLNAVITGELNDPETELPHIDHFLCNIMFLHVLGLRNE